jgi:hypothetical protein
MARPFIERLRTHRGKAAVIDWMGHPELQIDYINTPTGIGELHR